MAGKKGVALPDVLKPGLAAVFCGTAAGKVSAARGAYYAKQGNRFWTVLAEIGLTPRVLAPDDFREMLDFGLGLTDLAKRASGADHEIAGDEFDVRGLARKLLRARPHILALHGKKAAKLFLGRPSAEIAYGEQVEGFGDIRVFVLPSTSGAARGFWDIKPWRAVARSVKVLRST
jgi:double-stranded uracil-DNA glycosylase